MGKSVLSIFNDSNFNGLVYFTYIALACIGFDIGGELAFRKNAQPGKIDYLDIDTGIYGCIHPCYNRGLSIHRKMYIALVFGALSSATAPGATVDVLREYQASGPLTTTVFAVVGIDDGIAIIIYALPYSSPRCFSQRAV